MIYRYVASEEIVKVPEKDNVKNRRRSIQKEKKKINFGYKLSNKKEVDIKTKERINKLRIPPMWKNVEITENETDYLQATGADKKGRTQYIYHPLFVSLTKMEKFTRLKDFYNKMPILDKKINEDIKINNLSDKNFIIAIMFKIMKETHMRVGNDCYAGLNNNDDKKRRKSLKKKKKKDEKEDDEDTDTFGLTTLTSDHIKINGSNITFDFIGKKGVHQVLKMKDKFIAEILKKLMNLEYGSKRVFKTDDGIEIKSSDMNDYLKNCIGEEFSCKDFRTYGSNLLFIEKLCKKTKDGGVPTTKKEIKKILRETYDEVADELGHTRAISRSSYVMPDIGTEYEENPIIFSDSPNKILKKFLS